MRTPLQIVGVVEDQIGSPKNDGSRGSALYKVPIRLNRSPDGDESRLLVEAWNNPQQYTTMHRPGIARVYGDQIVLDGTTIEEVRDYHARTVKLAVDTVNAQMVELDARRAREKEAAEAAQKAHDANVSDVAKQIKFD